VRRAELSLDDASSDYGRRTRSQPFLNRSRNGHLDADRSRDPARVTECDPVWSRRRVEIGEAKTGTPDIPEWAFLNSGFCLAEKKQVLKPFSICCSGLVAGKAR